MSETKLIYTAIPAIIAEVGPVGKHCVIYGLYDPRTNELRYIGRTHQRLSKRLASHLRFRSTDICHRTAWIKSLIHAGIKPVIKVLEEVEGDSSEREIFWIRKSRSEGCRLTNSTDGGDGMVNPLPEVRKKLSAAMTGKPKSAAHARNISRGKKGVPQSKEHTDKSAAARRGKPGTRHSPETRRILSEKLTGRVFTDKHRDNLRRAHLGIKMPPRTAEHQAKLTASQIGKKRTEETRRRLSQSLTGRKLSESHRKNMSIAHQARKAVLV